MPDPAWLASAAGFAVAMSATPGPNNALAAASAANFGIRRTVPQMLGVALGFPAMLVLVALGAAEALRERPELQFGLRWVGAAWLAWLAWRLATAVPGGVGEAPGQRRARPLSFLEAALFQWVNPKAWLIAFAGIGTYAGPRVLPEAAVLAALFAVAALGSLAAWAALGAGIARLLPGPRALRRFNIAMAVLLLLSLLPLLRPG